jgi:transposase InsO family protein
LELNVELSASGIVACDFFTVDTVLFRRLYVLVFIELASRQVYLSGITANPTGDWATQQARNVIETFVERAEPIRFLIHDRDSKFTAAFDEVFRSEGIRTIRTPVRAPRANAFIERWIGTVRRECLDRISDREPTPARTSPPALSGTTTSTARTDRSINDRHTENRGRSQRPSSLLTVFGDETYSEDSFTSTGPPHERRRTEFPAPSGPSRDQPATPN